MKCVTAGVFLATVASVSAVSYISVFHEEWEAFKLEFNKSYVTLEDSFRKNVFRDNKHKIATHNKLYATGKKSYNLRMNEHGDLLHQEFASIMNGFRWNQSDNTFGHLFDGASFIEPDDDVVLPKIVDWREKGAVTHVKNQGFCGSCWAFAAIGALEGQHFRHTGKLVNLSEQNLIDCSAKHGCDGGEIVDAFQYMMTNGGIDTGNAYPYEGVDDYCRYEPQNSSAEVHGFVTIPKSNEHALKAAVAIIGPIATAIDASHASFQFYFQGVYDEPACYFTRNLTHAVLIIGYGTTEYGVDYWLVKNSWGRSWGDEGYMKILRNHNHCGIASEASYPLM